jgi:hypothetical protein
VYLLQETSRGNDTGNPEGCTTTNTQQVQGTLALSKQHEHLVPNNDDTFNRTNIQTKPKTQCTKPTKGSWVHKSMCTLVCFNSTTGRPHSSPFINLAFLGIYNTILTGYGRASCMNTLPAHLGTRILSVGSGSICLFKNLLGFCVQLNLMIDILSKLWRYLR